MNTKGNNCHHEFKYERYFNLRCIYCGISIEGAYKQVIEWLAVEQARNTDLMDENHELKAANKVILKFVRTDRLGNQHFQFPQCTCSANDWVLISGKYECNFCKAVVKNEIS